jgi:plasmid stability protein
MQPRRAAGPVTITVKNLPAELHRRLRVRAAQHRRSLNSEVVACLTATVMAERVDPEALLARARLLRREIAGRLTDAALSRLKSRGRS